MCLNISRKTLWLGLVAAMLVATVAAFVLEYGFGVKPCEMCWWQRYAHWTIGGFAALGWLALRGGLRGFEKLALVGAATSAGVGLGIAGWQYFAQHGWLPWPPSCVGDPDTILAGVGQLLEVLNNTSVVPCDKETFTLLGLSLAGWNILLMLGVVGWLSGWRETK